MDAYAGYYLEEQKLKDSASGGAVSAISERFIQNGGIVYGASYSQDVYSAVYKCAEQEGALKDFRGSKYVYVNKALNKKGFVVSVYEDAVSKLEKGIRVLFIGLGCDIGALLRLAKVRGADTERLFTVELLCDGVTSELVHKEYVCDIEKMYGSKVREFSVRYKEKGWVPPYIYAKLENGKDYKQPFYDSDYGFAFLNYKRKACYTCCFKNKNHFGDVIAGDFWGCQPGMEVYKEKGVSLLMIQSQKGNALLNDLDEKIFFKKRIHIQYALYHNPRYFTPHEWYPKWDMFDRVIKAKGLREAVRACMDIRMPESFKNHKADEVILWGAGNCFHQYISIIRARFSEICVVDSNEIMWGRELEYGLICQSPDILKEKKNIFVFIMIEDISAAFQIANRLLDLGITKFDYIKNWIYYRDI